MSAEGAYVGAHGFSDVELGLLDTHILPPNFAQLCAFQLHPQHTYTAHIGLTAALKAEGLTAQELEVLHGGVGERFRKLHEAAEREASKNASELREGLGRVVRYGDVVQLRHLFSLKFLAVSNTPALASQEQRSVVLEEAADDACWFRVMPRLRLHVEGDRVHFNDPVLLQHVKTSFMLRVNSALHLLDNGRRQVSAAGPFESPTSFKTSLYRSYKALQPPGPGLGEARQLLFSGELVRLLHKEANAVVSCDRLATTFQLPVSLAAADARARGSIESMFELQHADPLSGDNLRWGGHVRLLHVPSGRLLSLRHADTSAGDGSGRARYFDLHLDSQHRWQQHPAEVDVDTRFELLPQYPSTEAFIGLGDIFRIRHVRSGCWLHQAEPGVVTEADRRLAAKEHRLGIRKAVERVQALWRGFKLRVALSSNGSSELARATADEEAAEKQEETAGAAQELSRLRLVACSIPHDEDVYGVLSVERAMCTDLAIINSHLPPLEAFTKQFRRAPLPAADDVDFSSVMAALTALILLVTESDDPDPITREGMPDPQRQQMMDEVGVSELLVSVINMPLRRVFRRADVENAQLRRSQPALQRFERTGTLCMMLYRHILRGNEHTKQRAGRLVPMLQSMLGFGFHTAATLTVVFQDNEQLLRRTNESHVKRFVTLIRNSGRKGRFVDFLTGMCSCNGKAVRANQWKVCRLFAVDAPELLLHFGVASSDGSGGGGAWHRVLVRGSPKYFRGADGVELGEYLRTADAEAVEYLVALIRLFAALAAGRNIRNVEPLRALLPYSLLLAVAVGYNEEFPNVASHFCAVARELYVGHEPQQRLCHVQTVRVWDGVYDAAASGALAPRLTTRLPIDWTAFDDLKRLCLRYLRRFRKQDARQVAQNKMVLQLLMLVHAMLEAGHFVADEMADFMPVLFDVVDGRSDVVGRVARETARDRYKPWAEPKCDNTLIMECKLRCCFVLHLVCRMRTDLQLSLILARYHREWDDGLYVGLEGDDASFVGSANKSASDAIAHASTAVGTVVAAVTNSTRRSVASSEQRYTRLIDEVPVSKRTSARRLSVRLPEDYTSEVLDYLPFSQRREDSAELEKVVVDLTHYEHKGLVSAALGLLVQSFQIETDLLAALSSTQLLVVEAMLRLHGTVVDLQRQLSVLAARSTLYDDEKYDAVRILSKLTEFCAEEGEGSSGVSAAMSGAPSLRSKGTGRSKSSSGAVTGVYLRLLGNAEAAVGSTTLRFTKVVDRMARPGEYVSLAGGMYRVIGVDAAGLQCTLSKPIGDAVGGTRPADLERLRRDGELWVMLLVSSPTKNSQAQTLLHNMSVHNVALRLLEQLHFDPEPLPRQSRTRAVGCAIFRLLQAMAVGNPANQRALVEHADLFISYLSANLNDYDVSPTDMLSVLISGNRAACAQASEEMMNTFVTEAVKRQWAGVTRVLRVAVMPSDQPLRRNQNFVMQALADKGGALQLYNGAAARLERRRLFEANEHNEHPHGPLVYHMELVALIAACCAGRNSQAALLARELIRLPELLEHLLEKELPDSLRASYLGVLRSAYFETEHIVREVAAAAALPRVFEAFLADIRNFVDDVLPSTNLVDDEDAGAVAFFISESVLPTLLAFYRSPSYVGGEMVGIGRQLGDALLQLYDESLGYEQYIDTAKTRECLDEMCRRGVTDRSVAVAVAPATAGPTVAAVGSVEEAPHPQKHLHRFVAKARNSFDIRGSFNALVSIFSAGIDDPDADLPNLRNLIEQLLNSDGGPSSEVDRELDLTTMRILIAILDLPAADGRGRRRARQSTLVKRQERMVELGAHCVCLKASAATAADFYRAGVGLGLKLLEGGNAAVQAAFYAELRQPQRIVGVDGTAGGWLEMIKSRLRLGVSEIVDRKLFDEALSERLAGAEVEPEPEPVPLGLDLLTGEPLARGNDYETSAFVVETLEFMRLFCEGHYQRMQQLLREPPDSHVNIVAEICNLLVHLEAELNANNLDQVLKATEALTELVQGEQSRANATQLVQSQLPDALEKLLNAAADDARSDLRQPHELLNTVTTLLLALLEGGHNEVEERLLRVLDVQQVAVVAAHCYHRGLEARGPDGTPTDASERLLDPGFALCILLLHLLHFQLDQGIGSITSISDMLTETFGAASLDALQREIAKVEIVNAEGSLERVYFRVPNFCLLLPPSTRHKIVWDVDRDTPGKQLRDLIDWAHPALAEMKHQQTLRRHFIWRVVMRRRRLFDNLIFAMAVVQNGILIMRFSLALDVSPDSDVADVADSDAGGLLATLYSEAFYLFGTLQLLACIITGVIYAIATLPVRASTLWKQVTGFSAHEAREQLDLATLAQLQLQVAAQLPLFLLSDWQLLMYVAFAVAALVGLIGSPFWFSVHLLDLVNKSPDLKNVFRAVTLNGRSIVMTALFGLIIIYLYAIVGFLFSQDAIILDNYPDEDIPMCTNLAVCWAAAINEGLRGSDIGVIVDPVGADEPLTFVFNFLYQLTFWIVVITVLLNVIFGIIIDTFGELRADHAFKKNHMETTCFICGIDRFTFDTKGRGFEEHIDDDHNMWNYLFLVIYLREKDPTTYNGWEQYVAAKLKEEDTSFIPRNTALVLKEVHEREKAEGRAVLDRTGALLDEVHQLARVVDGTNQMAEQLLRDVASTAELQTLTLETVEKLAPEAQP